MSFLNQLKSQANALQSEQTAQQNHYVANTRLTEAAAKTAWLYVTELLKQLNVIGPTGPQLSLDGRTPWPAMKLLDFRVDARKKILRDQEVFDYIAMSWRIVPLQGAPVSASVSANFPPDLQRIEARLSAGSVQHERVNVRHPEKNTLQAIRFDFYTEALHTSYPAPQIQSQVLDELAKLMVGQPTRFI